MVKPKAKSFQYLGKTYEYTTPASLGKKLKLTTNETKKLLEKSKRGTMFAYLTDKEGNVARQNLRLKPLVARNFGIKRINNRTITKDNFTNYKGITISSKLPKSKPINLSITITAGIKWSDDYETKKFQVNKNDRIAQLRLKQVEKVEWAELTKETFESIVESETNDRSGGFGSTGR